MSNSSSNGEPPPRVFISYSWDSDAHKQRVLELAERLRDQGVDAQLDQYEVSPPESWPNWMWNQIEDADFVLVVCTETYHRRFRGKEEPGRGQGVTWEGTILTQSLYDAGSLNARFVPVVLAGEDTEHIPLVLRGATRYQLDRDYEKLYRHLTDQPEFVKRPLGAVKELPPRNPSQVSSVGGKPAAVEEISQEGEAQGVSPGRVDSSSSGQGKKPTFSLARRARRGLIGLAVLAAAVLTVWLVGRGRANAGDLEEGPLGMRFRYVPHGTYTIGSPEDEPGRANDEWLRQVHLEEGFWMAETEVTRRQWQEFAGESSPLFKHCENCPIESVSWFDVVAFSNWVSERSGLGLCYELSACSGDIGRDFSCDVAKDLGGCSGYRLPTEMEWEIAARAGSTTAIYTGPLIIEGDCMAPNLDPIAWYCGNSGKRLHPVAAKQPNAWGLYDMLGNVWEWAGDWKSSNQQPIVRGDPEESWMDGARVLRGGSWYSGARFVRAAYRQGGPADLRIDDLVFA